MRSWRRSVLRPRPLRPQPPGGFGSKKTPPGERAEAPDMWPLVLIGSLAPPQVQQGGVAAATVRPEVRSVQERVMAGRTDPLELTLAAPVQLPNGRRVGASMRPAASAEAWLVYTRGNLCQSVITHGP